jgi:hypothetical protein
LRFFSFARTLSDVGRCDHFTPSVLASACPNLIAESKLYAYPEPTTDGACDENPIDEHNHALAALRYLVRSIDAGGPVRPVVTDGDGGGPPQEPKRASGMNPDREQVWTNLFP